MSTSKLRSIIFKIRVGCLILLKNTKISAIFKEITIESCNSKIGAELFDSYEGPNNANISTFFNE